MKSPSKTVGNAPKKSVTQGNTTSTPAKQQYNRDYASDLAAEGEYAADSNFSSDTDGLHNGSSTDTNTTDMPTPAPSAQANLETETSIETATSSSSASSEKVDEQEYIPSASGIEKSILNRYSEAALGEPSSQAAESNTSELSSFSTLK